MRVWQYKIYLARHLGMSLKDMGQVPAHDFLAMVEEVEYQRRLEQYPLLHIMGQVVCALINTKTSKHRPHEFIGDEPKRSVTKAMVKKDNYQIILGDGETYTLGILDVNMMEAVEDEFDKSWGELFEKPRVKVVKSMLWQMLLPNYPEITKDQVGKLVTSKVLPALVAIITGMSDG